MGELRFNGRVAVVSGAGNGIGKANAIALARRGAKLVINDLGCDVMGRGSDPAVSETTARQIRDEGGEAIALFGDIGASGVADAAIDLALRTFGRIDIVVGSAVIERVANFYDLTREDILDHLNPDLFGDWSLCKAAWPHFAKQNYGRIVLSASSAMFGGAMGVPYALSKGAIVAFNRSLAGLAQAASLDIKSNVISPYAYSRMFDVMGDPKSIEEAKRLIPPEGVSPTLLVLAHESCPVSGQIYGCANGKVQKWFFASSEGLEQAGLTPEFLLENWGKVDDLEGWREVIGTSMDMARPFMQRAKAISSGVT
jgi:NAD(P)-dependent dehydrogenase (short-subunit alcohol dehydrogenase family)